MSYNPVQNRGSKYFYVFSWFVDTKAAFQFATNVFNFAAISDLVLILFLFIRIGIL